MTPTRDRTPGLERWALPAILALAALLRIWGLGFGLPNLDARPDEMDVVPRAIRLLSGDLNPHFFHYPSLYFYLLGLVFAVVGLSSVALGSPMEEFLTRAVVDPGSFILLGRWVTALAGVLTVYGVYRVGLRLQGRWVGILSAGFLSVAHLHVRESHFATTDVLLTLFVVGSVHHMLGIAEKGDTKSYLWAGIFAGLAVSTKYVGLLLPGVVFLAHIIAQRRPEIDARWRHIARGIVGARGLWIFAGASLSAFVLTSPYAVLDWGLFSTHFRFQLGHLTGGHGMDLGIGGVYHLLHTLPKGLGWPIFAAGLGGGVWALRRHPGKATVLLAFPLLFYFSTFTSRTLFLRYMLPVIPFLCLTAAWWVARICTGRRLVGRCAVTAGVLLSVVPFADAIATDRRLARVDTRVEAAMWLDQEMEETATTIFQTGARWGWLQLPLTADSSTVLLNTALRAPVVEGRARLRWFSLLQARAWVTESLRKGGGFATRGFDLVTGFEGEGSPEWIVTLESPLSQYSQIPEGLASVLEESYEPVRTFRATLPGREGWYDQHDSFYLPFKRVRAVARPGPDVTLYRRIAVPDFNDPDRPDNRSRQEAR